MATCSQEDVINLWSKDKASGKLQISVQDLLQHCNILKGDEQMVDFNQRISTQLRVSWAPKVYGECLASCESDYGLHVFKRDHTTDRWEKV
jgi:hypothetical protein